jgi:hypothetical protein
MDTCGEVEQNKDFKLGKETSTMSNILFYCIRGKTSLLPMEIILLILQELEELKILVKLAKRRIEVVKFLWFPHQLPPIGYASTKFTITN